MTIEGQGGIAEEMLEECGFWAGFTGEIRRPADLLAVRLFWVLRVLLRSVILYLRFRFRRQPGQTQLPSRCRVLAIYVTENQRRAFEPWLRRSDGFQTASWMDGADWNISWSRCGALGLRYLLPVYRVLCRRPDYARTIPWLEEFVRYRVGLVLADDLYDRARPQVVAVSNDHSGMFRAFMRQARRRGCRLVYTQHASIGRNLPRLQFDLTMLDGAQAFLHYLESGRPTGHIVITGRNRPRVAAHAAPDPSALRIGIATNWDDSLLDWLAVLRRVRLHFPDTTLRCHPAETRKRAWRLLCSLTGVRLQEGGLEDFLSRTDVLISGMSGIILDAALHGIPCLVNVSPMRKTEAMRDYFGYQRFGLCAPIGSLDDLPHLIRRIAQRPTEQEKVAVYEAGLIADPVEEKRLVLDEYLSALHEPEKVDGLLARRYAALEHDGIRVFAPSEYAALVQKHGWFGGSDFAGRSCECRA